MVMFHEQNSILVILFSTLFLRQTWCSGVGRCPKMEYMEDFNVTRFSGHWYEIERSFYLMQVVSSCVNVYLAENVKGQLEVAVKTKSRWSNSLTVSEGLASQTKRDPSILQYRVVSTLPKVFNRYLPGAGLYQVLDTDYTNYAIIWSCASYELLHTDLIWIWGRQREIDANLRANIYHKLALRRLDSERLILPKNSNCTD